MMYYNRDEALYFQQLLGKCANSFDVSGSERFAVVADQSAIVTNLIDAIVFMLREHLSPCGSCGGREGHGPNRCEECSDRPRCFRMPSEEDARVALMRAVDSIVHWDDAAVYDGRLRPSSAASSTTLKRSSPIAGYPRHAWEGRTG